tara:strand:- start:244 stop:450 length:207 start_codon:yes stop_codon:yes gene_type:complete
MEKHIFEKPVSEDGLLVATHTVGFDMYIEKLGEMHDISKELLLSAIKDDQDIRDEIIGNFYKAIKESK